MKEILLNIESKEIRYAFLKFGKLYDFQIERSKQITGNIYRGSVTNILHNIQSAFIDIGEKESGFVHMSDILENIKNFEEMLDMDLDIKSKKSSNDKKDIDQIFKKDQPVLVQVVKEPIGGKGARLTSNISVAGRYLVLLPNTPHKGVSKKIENKKTRDKLKKFIKSVRLPEDMGLICRTASKNVKEELLKRELKELTNRWKEILKNFNSSKKPSCLYEESDIIKRSVITAVDKKLNRLLIDDHKTYIYAKKIFEPISFEHNLKIELYREKTPMFEKFKIEKEIDKALKRKVWLNCGGYLFFDKTEAMFTIDVNSGRSLQAKPQGDLEEALVRINLEAAEEIARQFRIRNIGGLIVCDFIDMRFRRNQKRVLDRLRECMKDDPAKCTILGMSEFGLIEMTRQRKRKSLSQIIFTHCPYCKGNGTIKSKESILIEMERAFRKLLFHYRDSSLKITIHPDFFNFLKDRDRAIFEGLAKEARSKVEFDKKDTLHLNDYIFSLRKTNKKIEV